MSSLRNHVTFVLAMVLGLTALHGCSSNDETATDTTSNDGTWRAPADALAEESLVDVPTFNTPEALIAYLKDVLRREYHPVEEFYSLLWYDETDIEGRNSYYFYGHFFVPRALLFQALNRAFDKPYRLINGPLYPHQIMIPRQLTPDRVEVECKDDQQRLEFLYLRKVDDQWLIDISTFKNIRTWDRLVEQHEAAWGKMDDVPSGMREILADIDRGKYADAAEAQIAAELLLPGGQQRGGLPPDASITTSEVPASADD